MEQMNFFTKFCFTGMVKYFIILRLGFPSVDCCILYRPNMSSFQGVQRLPGFFMHDTIHSLVCFGCCFQLQNNPHSLKCSESYLLTLNFSFSGNSSLYQTEGRNKLFFLQIIYFTGTFKYFDFPVNQNHSADTMVLQIVV